MSPSDHRRAPIEAVVTHWSVGRLRGWSRASSGLIHETYRVETDRGVYCLQALHPALSSPGILADWRAVLDHLERVGFPAPRFVPPARGGIAVEFQGRRWRMSTWIDGHSVEQVDGPDRAREAARLFGRFYRAMETFDHEFQTDHPLHDWSRHAEALRTVLDRTQDVQAVGHWREQVAALAPKLLQGIERNTLDPNLPRRVVHGDPKISNVLFDEADRACGLVDLDTCCRHTLLVDLGDALRSWCMDGPEDACTSFRAHVLSAAMEGWAGSGLRLSSLEVRELRKAPALISYELSARFLRDVLEDSYFGYDSNRYPSRRHHNLARARAMARLAEAFEQDADFVRQEAERLGAP